MGVYLSQDLHPLQLNFYYFWFLRGIGLKAHVMSSRLRSVLSTYNYSVTESLSLSVRLRTVCFLKGSKCSKISASGCYNNNYYTVYTHKQTFLMISVCVDITVAVVTSVPFKVHPTNNTPLSNQLLSLFIICTPHSS